jgi:hypothetical protein
VSRCLLAGARLQAERRHAHLMHRLPETPAIDGDALRAEERPSGEELVDAPHEREIVVIGSPRRSLDAGRAHLTRAS